MSEREKTTVIITYNSVAGFKPGWHKGARLFIHALVDDGWGQDKGQGEDETARRMDATAKLADNLNQELNMSPKNVDEFYIYAGKEVVAPFALASRLRELNPEARIVFTACECGWEEKIERVSCYYERHNFEIIPCECGGQNFLGRLAKKILSD